MNKKVSVSVLFLMVCMMLVMPVFAAEDLSVEVNGRQVEFPDVKPFIDENGRTLVPVRFISEALGAGVDWEASTKTVIITKASDVIWLTIGEKKAIKNGQEIVFDSSAVIKDSRTFVPLRFVTETLGAAVAWDGATRTVRISSGTSNEFSQILSKIPNTLQKDRALMYIGDGSKDPSKSDFIISDEGDSFNIYIFNHSEGTLDVVKDVLEIFYPDSCEEVYVGLKSAIDVGIEIFGLEFDNRVFNAQKFDDNYTLVNIGK